MLKRWFKKLFDLIERPLPFFFTFHLRPKKADKIGVTADKLLHYPKIAIVIQGPIVYDQDFTLETIKLYKKYFPKATIILSTWNYERVEYIQKIKEQDIEVLSNEPPQQKGSSNVNYQIVSSRNGIKLAKEKSVDYVLKTRTDQRIYNPNALEYFVNLTNNFVLTGDYKQNKRIIGCSLNTFKYRPYGLSDMNLFGQIDDLLTFWNVDLDDNGKMVGQMPTALSEVYFVVEYLKKIGRGITNGLQDSWQIFADHFCVVDQQDIDLYWYKYARMREYKYLRYDEMRNSQEMTFLEWFNIYTNLKNKAKVDLNKIEKVIP